MRSDGPAERRIEFVVDAPGEDADDELLDVQPRHRRGLLVGALALAAAVGAGLLWVRQGSDPAPPQPSSSAPASRAVAAPTPSFAQVQGAGPGAFRFGNAASCPANVSCLVDGDITVPVVSALFDAFPGSRVTTVRTVRTVGNALWFRQIIASTGRLSVILEIAHPPTDGSGRQTNATLSDGATYVRQLAHGLLVQIEVDGPRDQLPTTSVLYALAEDERLVRLA